MKTLVRSETMTRPSHRGQAAVEAALVILPLLAILCAIIDFSMAMFIRNSLTHAVREGARYAITGQTGAGGNSCQKASIRYIVQQNAMGFLSGDNTYLQNHVAIAYYDPKTLVDVTALPGANREGNVVRVTVSGYPWLWMLSGVWQNVSAVREGAGPAYSGLTIGAASSDVIEPPPGGVPPCLGS